MGRGVRTPQTILGHFMRNFIRFHASFSAFSSCLEKGDSYIPFLDRRSDIPPLTFFGCWTPQLEFLGCPDTLDTHSGCATVFNV